MKEPGIQVGIMSGLQITFRFIGKYRLSATGEQFDGLQQIEMINGQAKLNGKIQPASELIFTPEEHETASFELRDVTIGIKFHWERKENQQFKGGLKFITENEQLTAINLVPLEDYLISVISSEMNATSNPELLKAHAVISRSWLMAQIEKSRVQKLKSQKYQNIRETSEEFIRWYDREDHLNFDVCADDHCQRYQGITRQSTPLVEQAVTETRGMMLTYDSQICDARFSKSCGGISETFENVWEPVVHLYLQAVIDNPEIPEQFDTDLSKEPAAEKWIRNTPPAFCNTNDKAVLKQVLNDYDQETSDFYRWKISYQQETIAELISRKSGRDFGSILDLIPMERGKSGRLIKLKIVGSKLTLIIGKELEIRKTLSESHLYSSAFVVDKRNIRNGIPGEFVLTGAGWGHGVGLCQIGAAVMSAKGYKYNEILLHYFRGANIEKLY